MDTKNAKFAKKKPEPITVFGVGETLHVQGKVVFTASYSHDTNKKMKSNIFFNVRDPIESFTGRQKELTDLQNIIEENRKNGQFLTVLSQTSVITGLGGIGKTETVRKYINLHARDYKHIVWIDAENPSEAENQFQKLAAQELGIPLTDGQNKQLPLKQLLSKIYQKLCLEKDLLLLVFDNAESLEDTAEHNDGIRRFLPQSLSDSYCKPVILVTSRNQEWGDQKVIQLGLWSDDECVKFVLKVLLLQDTEENQSLALKLGETFGRFPLAMQVAVSVIRQQSKNNKKYGIQNMIDDYENGMRKILTKKQLESSSTKTTMMVLWNVTLKKIQAHAQGELAIRILNSMAFLSPICIPKPLVIALIESAEDDLADALLLLVGYSLVNNFDQDFAIHRMIQDVTVEGLRSPEEIIEVELEGNTLSIQPFSKEEQLLLEITLLFQKYLSSVKKVEANFYNNVLSNAVHVTNYAMKKLFLDQLHGFSHTVGKEVMNMRMDDAYRIFETLAAHCAQFDEEIVKRTEDMYLRFLCDLLILKGQPQEALKRYEALYERQTNLWGPEDSGTLVTKAGFGTAKYDLGEKEEALHITKDVEEKLSKVLGPTHSHILVVKRNLVFSLQKEGKFEEALTALIDIKSQFEKQCGPHAYETLVLTADIGDLLSSQGKPEEALKTFSNVLPLMDQNLGAMHEKTIAVRYETGYLLQSLEHYDKALEVFEDALENSTLANKTGANYLTILEIKHNIAGIWKKKEEFVKAIDLYEDIIRQHEQNGSTSSDVFVGSKNNLGWCYYYHGNYNKAAQIAQEVKTLLKSGQDFHESVANQAATLYFMSWDNICEGLKQEPFDEEKLTEQYAKLSQITNEDARKVLNHFDWDFDKCYQIFKRFCFQVDNAPTSSSGLKSGQ